MSLIHVSGSAYRSFHFPAPRPIAYEFYGSIPRIVPFLPRIVLVATAGHGRYRVAYRSRELNAYDVDIPCDLQVHLDDEERLLRIDYFEEPLFPHVEPHATLRSCRATGRFHIQSKFFDEEEATRIEYNLSLSSDLPKPLGLMLVPTAVMSTVVQRIVNLRINEIVDQFIIRSIKAYPAWLAARR